MEIIDTSLLYDCQLVKQQIYDRNKFVAKIIYDDIQPYFEVDKAVTGQHLRGQCEDQIDQTYVFPFELGSTLYELIKQNKKFKVEEIQDIKKQLLIGLYQIHKSKSIGRCFNIKNIIYHEDQIVMTVFGMYPQMPNIPPEFLRTGIYDRQIDIWLLGLVMLQLENQEVIENIDNNHQILKQMKMSEETEKMLEENPLSRINFTQVIEKNLGQGEIYQFYLKNNLNLSPIISGRESFNREYFEWAVPRECQKQLRVPRLIAFYHKIKYSSESIIPNNQGDNFEEEKRFISVPVPISNEPQQELDQAGIIEDMSGYIDQPEFLPYRNRIDQEQKDYPDIWNNIHFQSYRFYWIDKILEILQTDKSDILTISKYYLIKVKLVIINEFIESIELKRNIFQIDEESWHRFLNNSLSLQKLIKDLKCQYKLDCSMFSLNVYAQTQHLSLSNMQANEMQIYDQVIKQITETIPEKQFQDLKRPYRLCLNYLLLSCQEVRDQTQSISKYVKLQFYLMCGLLINSIFSADRNTIFTVVMRKLQITILDSPTQIEEFIATATVDEFQEQITQIQRICF